MASDNSAWYEYIKHIGSDINFFFKNKSKDSFSGKIPLLNWKDQVSFDFKTDLCLIILYLS